MQVKCLAERRCFCLDYIQAVLGGASFRKLNARARTCQTLRGRRSFGRMRLRELGELGKLGKLGKLGRDRRPVQVRTWRR